MYEENSISSTANPLFLAADNHNLAAEGESWYTSLPKFIAVSAVSGLNSFIETGAAIANWAGADVKAKTTAEVLSSMDDDLGQYYMRHKEGADLLGFLAGSLIPGTLGIKALQSGQKFVAGTSFLNSAAETGWIGRNAETITGLVAPKADRFIFAARHEIEAANTAYSLTSNNVLKAIGTNAWQNALEGAAFETAVQATMFKSPVIQDQDAGTIAYSVLVGGLAGGVLGGAFGAAKIVGELKGYRELSDVAKGPYREGTHYATASTAADKIILSAEHRDTAQELGALFKDDIINDAKLNPSQRETLIAAREKSAFALSSDRHAQMNNQIRANINALAGRDNVAGNLLADVAIEQDKHAIAQMFAYSMDVTRQGERSAAMREAAERVAKTKDVNTFTGDLQHRTVSLWGDDVGNIYEHVPTYRPVEILRDKAEIDTYVLKTVQGFKNFAGAVTEELTGRQAEAAWVFGRTQVSLKDFSAKTIQLSTDSVHHMDAFLRVLQNAEKPEEILAKKKVMLGDVQITSVDQLTKQVMAAKEDLVGKLLLKRAEKGEAKITDELIGAIADVTPEFVRGSREAKHFWAFDSKQTALDKLRASSATLKNSLPESADYVPQYAKISYKLPSELDDFGNPIKLKNLTPDSGLSDAIAAQKIHKEGLLRASKALGVEGEVDIPLDVMLGAGSAGAGPGMFGFAAGKMGKAAAYVEMIGSKVAKPLIEKYQKEVIDKFTAPLFALRNDADAAAEWALANKFLGSQKGPYSLVDNKLIPASAAKSLKEAGAEAELVWQKLEDSGEAIFTVKNKKTLELIGQLQEQNATNISRYETAAHALGESHGLNPNVVPVIRPDPKSHPFIALVDTGKMIDGGQKSMLFARTEKELQEQIAKTRAIHPDIDVYTPPQAEAWYKARNEYEYQNTLHETYTGSQFQQEGIYNSLYLQTDPAAMVDNILAHFNRQATSLARKAIETRYDVEFNFWKKQGQIYTDTALSRLPRISGKVAESEVANPFTDLVKTALNISRKSEYPIWNSVNEKAEQLVSQTVDKVRSFGFQDYSKLEEVNKAYDKLGVKPAFGAALESLQKTGSLIMVGEDSALINSSVTKGALSEFVSKSHGILSLATLGLDAINALVNTLGATILRTTEVRHLLQAIKEGDANIAGKLAGVQIPGTTDSIFSTPKLIANAMRDFGNKEIKARITKEWDLDASAIRNHDEIIEQLTLRAGETDQSLLAKPKAAYRMLQELGPKITGNQLAEQFNRFVTIRSIEQITDAAVKLGKINADEAKVYINTVLNRVEGNVTASQRPILFQGPIGAAIGLFQGYQFNLIQQLLRYVKDGSAKDAAMLLGLQGTMFGMNSMPAFQAINQHLIGNAPGNPNHTDAYDITKKIAGNKLGDFLLYGMPSNLLGAGLYTRGDINPRSITLVPNSIEDTPIYGAYSRFFGSLKEVYSKAAGGVPVWNSMLFGLEHQGLVRPLGGLAQVLQGYSTSNQGSLVMAKDLLSWSSAVRLAGTRPLEEAKIRDALFRYNSYELHDKGKLKELSTDAKLASLSGDVDYSKFAQSYADLGGNTASFNKWMMNQYKTATEPQAQKIADQMKSPMAQKIQLMMDS